MLVAEIEAGAGAGAGAEAGAGFGVAVVERGGGRLGACVRGLFLGGDGSSDSGELGRVGGGLEGSVAVFDGSKGDTLDCGSDIFVRCPGGML
jgi:hypothetical protein